MLNNISIIAPIEVIVNDYFVVFLQQTMPF